MQIVFCGQPHSRGYLAPNPTITGVAARTAAHVWEDVAVSDNALARVVAQLCKALGDDAKVARYIGTVPTIGYRFVAEVVEGAVPAAAPPWPF